MGMRRLALLALLPLAVFALPAVSAGSGGDGGVPDKYDWADSGGTPSDWDGQSSAAGEASALAGDGTTGADSGTGTGADEATTSSNDARTTSSDGSPAASAGGPSAVAAQDPAPQPEGPGTQQPGDPGAQPPPVDTPGTPGGVPPAVDAPAGGVGGTGGSLPMTGVEVLQLALLGIALLLVGARLRVLALRRKRGSYVPYEDDLERPIAVRRTQPRRSRATPERDAWPFPDPNEPAPTGLLPSTASARRRARTQAGGPSRGRPPADRM
jgi:hypothetical protein